MKPATITVQCFVDFAVDEAGKVSVRFAPREMDPEFFAHAEVNGRTLHEEGWDTDSTASDEEWDTIQAALDRIVDALRHGEAVEINVIP